MLDKYPRTIAAGTLAVAVMLCTSGANAQPLSHWTLDEAATGAVVDSVGGFNGTNNGATINQPGQFGPAYDFDGANDYVNIGDLAAFDFDYNTPSPCRPGCDATERAHGRSFPK